MRIRTILLADDDEDDRELFELVLGKSNGVSLLASLQNGREVLAFLNGLPASEFPDIIILDQNMPRLNGLETLQSLKSNERYSHIVVAIYSTFTDSRLMSQYKMLGAVAVLTKPSKMEEYHSMFAQVMDLMKQTV